MVGSRIIRAISVALASGSRLGPYEVIAQIGAGGMGEVYRARDTRLGRDVALKILPEAFAADIERPARFKREAQVLASLNHPNIAAIYGFEDSGRVSALAMELVEGPTLADRITRGALPLDEALRIATQIADALQAAHEKGVVHRDLKPSNIKVRPDGTVKVLDFGLAKAFETVDSSERSQSPTLTSPAHTLHGVILGTAAYMSPEQAGGGEVDRRSDIWSFGVVLYEMLTGRPLFEGDSVARVLARVLERQLDFSALPPATPSAIRRLLRRCLERDRKRRLHDIADARIEMEDVLVGRDDERTAPLPASPAQTDRGRLNWPLAAFVVILAGLAVWPYVRPTREIRRPLARFTLSLPTALGGFPSLTISRDGARLALESGAGEIYIRALEESGFKKLSTGGFAFNPAFSPDGESLAFADGSQQELKRTSISNGGETTVARLDDRTIGIAWGPQDVLFFATLTSGGLMKVSARGGEPERLTTLDRGLGEAYHLNPDALPNGKGVLFTACGSGDNVCRVAVVALQTGKVTYLVPGSVPRYVTTGHIVYMADGGLRAIGFDQERLTLTGESPASIAANVSATLGSASFGVSATGSLVYVSGIGAPSPQRTLVWVDRMGREEPLGLEPKGYGWVRVSPDGQRLAVEIDGLGPSGVWVSEISRPTLTPITTDVKIGASFPLWTPDSRRIVFSAGAEYLWTAADGTSTATSLFSMDGKPLLGAEGWADGGRTLVFSYGAVSRPHIGLLTVDGKPMWKPLIERVTDASMLSVSPDGKWLAYQSHASGQYEIYVERFPGLGDRQRVSTDQGGWACVWSPDGRDIFYRRISDGAMMAAHVQTTPTLKIDAPVRLFESRQYEPLVPPQAGGPAGRSYDVAPNGRFLMIKEAARGQVAEIVLVQNWTEELKHSAQRK
jgi:serine/threonine-protein kinase